MKKAIIGLAITTALASGVLVAQGSPTQYSPETPAPSGQETAVPSAEGVEQPLAAVGAPEPVQTTSEPRNTAQQASVEADEPQPVDEPQPAPVTLTRSYQTYEPTDDTKVERVVCNYEFSDGTTSTRTIGTRSGSITLACPSLR